MIKILASGADVANFYMGADGRPASGPCMVLVSLDQQADVAKAMFLDNDDNSPTIVFSLTDKNSIQSLISLTPEYPDPLNLQPFAVADIDLNNGSISAGLEVIQTIIGGLANHIPIYTVTQQNNLSKIAICDPVDQGLISLIINASGNIPESEWLAINAAAIKVDSITV